MLLMVSPGFSSSARGSITLPQCWAATASLLLALASPAFLHAQFQEPTQEELKITVDSKAPGAAAVYLDLEETANDRLHFQSFFARIKILTEKGKELATVEIPYLHDDPNSAEKVTEIKGRTIHSDGTIIPLVGKPEDLLVSKSLDRRGNELQINRKVFVLPSVEVGSIIEYHYEIQQKDDVMSSPHWEIQRPYFVHKAHYAFTPAKDLTELIDERDHTVHSLIWRSRLPPGVSVKSNVNGANNMDLRTYRVDVTDIPPVPEEEWMPPIQSFLYQVFFYYKSAYSPADFWSSSAKEWSKDVDRFAKPSQSIKEAVSHLVAPGDSDLDKAKKLYLAVQALDNTDFSRHRSESERKQLRLKTVKHAQDTWEQKSGSSEDIAQLYLALLRTAGLNANAMKVVNRERWLFDPAYLTLDQLDDTIVLLNTGGKEIGLDPGEKMCPFKLLDWKHSSAAGVRQGDHDHLVGVSPGQSYLDNKTSRNGNITIDPNGAITGTINFTMAGQEALRWRQIALQNDLDEVKRQFDDALGPQLPTGIEGHVDQFAGLDDPYVNLSAVVNVRGNLGAPTSKRLVLPGFFFETRTGHFFVNQEKRLEPVDMRYDEQITDRVVYHLPAGFVIEGTPQNNDFSWTGHAVYTTKSIPATDQITVIRQLTRAFALATPEEYNDLRGFYQKVAAADQQQLVLTRAPVVKGN